MGSKLFKRLGIALTGIAMAIGVGVGLSQRSEYKEARAGGPDNYSFTIDISNLDEAGSGTGYAKYNGDGTYTASGTNTNTMDVTITQYQTMVGTGDYDGKLQFQKNKGYIYNKTSLGNISRLTFSDSSNLTVYLGTSQNPTSGTTASSGSSIAEGYSYFSVICSSSGTGSVTSFAVEFTIPDVAVSSVSLNKNSTSIGVGGTETLTATVLPNNATNKAITWSSDAEGVATVDENGVVTGVSAGTANITATSQADGTKHDSCAVEVVAPIAVSSVSLDKDSASINKGSNVTLTATVLPNNATNKNVTWESSDESVATVEAGVVTGVAAGSATITVKSVADNTKLATCAITVNAPLYDSRLLNMNISTYTSHKGTYYENQSVVDESKTDYSLTWMASTIGAYSDYMMLGDYGGSLATKTKIEGYDEFASLSSALTSSSLWGSSKTMVMFTKSFGIVDPNKVVLSWTGNSQTSGTQKAYLLATNDNGLSWTKLAEDTAINQGASNGDKISWENASTYSDGKSVAFAFIFTTTVSGSCGIRNVSWEIYGNSINTSMSWKANSVSISGDSNVEIGGTTTLTATFKSAYASDSVTWSSSDNDIATVGENTGVVTGVATGNATITATTSGGKTATKVITVIEATIHVTGVTLDEASLTIKQAGSATLTATVAPANATDSSVEWSITGDSDISVDQNGKVSVAKTATVGDTATVTVTTIDGSFTASCSITVSAFVGDYFKLTDTYKIHAGMVLVLGNNAKQAVSTGFGTFITAAQNSAVIVDGGLVGAGDVLEFTVSGTVGQWVLTDSSGNWLSQTSSSKNTLTLDKSGTNKYWDISISDGEATIANAAGDNYGAIYFNSGSPRFSNYTEKGTMALPEIYVKESNDNVLTFIKNNMRMGDTALKGETDTGACKPSGNNYYLLAKAALASLTPEERSAFQNDTASKYTAALARYNKWAIANNDAAPFDGNTTVVTPIRAVATGITEIMNDSNNTIIAIIIIACVSTLAIGGYFFIRRRKER